MKNCIFECLKYAFGFWGALAILGLLIVGLAALFVSTGGAAGAGFAAGLAALLEASAAATLGAKIAIAGGVGMIGSLVGCISTCVVKYW